MNETQPKTIIVMGPQGSGKGTQLSLLKKYFEEHLKHSVFQFSTGDGFRKVLNDTSYTAGLVKNHYNTGKLQPLFLTVTLWGDAFLQNLQDGQDIFIDGYPRTALEAETLDTAFDFYSKEKIDVLFFDLPEAEAIHRMKLRGRTDDTDEAIAERLAYYRNYTLPVFDYFKNNSRYVLHTIDAQPNVETIHQNVLQVLNLQ